MEEAYLCDGNKRECEKNHCYKWGGDGLCRHTSDAEHALRELKEETCTNSRT